MGLSDSFLTAGRLDSPGSRLLVTSCAAARRETDVPGLNTGRARGLTKTFQCRLSAEVDCERLVSLGEPRVLHLSSQDCPLIPQWSYFSPYLHVHIWSVIWPHINLDVRTQGTLEYNRKGRDIFLQDSVKMESLKMGGPWV